MINRRMILAVAAGLAFSASAASAQDWKAKYPELVFAKVPDENASGTSDRWTPLTEYLSRELGTKVTLRIANDYAAVIEGQRAGNIHIAMYGPSSYARAYIVGAKVEPFAIEVSGDGTKGYYSVLYVKSDLSFKDIKDLKGKNLCLVDPNSTSGNNVPRFAMDKMGIDPEKFFSKVVYSGSHENAVIGACPGHLRRGVQLVERRKGIEPAAHGPQGHGEGRRFQDHPEVRTDCEFANGVPRHAAGRPQGGDQEGGARTRGKGQGCLRQDLRRKTAAVRRGRPQGL